MVGTHHSDRLTEPGTGRSPPAFSQIAQQVLDTWQTTARGLDPAVVTERRSRFGPNRLPHPPPPGLLRIFLKQFLSPLIYILLIAAIVSLFIREWSDAGFILAVLLINAIVGTVQEYNAERSAEALQQMVTTRVRVIRGGEAYEIDAVELLPGDIVLLESGLKVPADMRLLESHALTIDESLLTGESQAIAKRADAVLDADTALGDRINMAYAGTHVAHGRGLGIVTATAVHTELGALASVLQSHIKARPPLLARLHKFVIKVAIGIGLAALLLAVSALSQGTPWQEVFLLAVALAVSAIPEGLPVAVTIALTIGMNRMARRQVIVRNLVAVETLGSCTHIASDKTGTLTMNALTATIILLPDNCRIEISGEGMIPDGELSVVGQSPEQEPRDQLRQLCTDAVLCNEGFLGRRDGNWTHHGDAVDVALLVMAHKYGVTAGEPLVDYPLLAQIAFESEQRFAATLHQHGNAQYVVAKGAVERVLPMCSTMARGNERIAVNAEHIEQQMHYLAGNGFRVLAIVDGEIELADHAVFSEEHLTGLTLRGLVGMLDPLRPDAQTAIMACRQAGIGISMITGDHPETALTSARALNLADELDDVVTGSQLLGADQQGSDAAALIAAHHVFARIEPRQKLDIVNALVRHGEVVAVTGDGANDAPALRSAHVGVAMGKSGTDVARESADIIVLDDRLTSIVAGIEQGRVTYRNIRKVIFLLISTGVSEVILFLLALFTGLPLPLLAVQLLWLNLVTNGIQDVALAFEPAEGDEMQHRPRPVNEPIFNRLMIRQVIVAAVTIGVLAFVTFRWLLDSGATIEEARNSTLLLMVLFENIHVLNCRSETASALRSSPLRNPLLLFGTLAAQLIHIGAMYFGPLQSILQVMPVDLEHWFSLLGIALSLLIVMEIHKKMLP